jgi:hypothetical protein
VLEEVPVLLTFIAVYDVLNTLSIKRTCGKDSVRYCNVQYILLLPLSYTVPEYTEFGRRNQVFTRDLGP